MEGAAAGRTDEAANGTASDAAVRLMKSRRVIPIFSNAPYAQWSSAAV
jgi:hypothetical protein